jgi:antitoxin YefM
MRTANYSELRSNLKSYLDTVVTDSEPLIVHRPGNNSVVVISLDEFNAIKETELIISMPGMKEKIARSFQQAKEGKVKRLTSVEDIDKLLGLAK